MTAIIKRVDSEYLYLIVLINSLSAYGLKTDPTTPGTVHLSSAGSLASTTRYTIAFLIILHSLRETTSVLGLLTMMNTAKDLRL